MRFIWFACFVLLLLVGCANPEGTTPKIKENRSMIKEVSINSFGESIAISSEGYVRSQTMRPSGGFEMRPIIQVYELNPERHAKIWELVELLDLDELKKLDSADYDVTIDIATTEERVIIKVSTQTFDSTASLKELKAALLQVRAENQW